MVAAATSATAEAANALAPERQVKLAPSYEALTRVPSVYTTVAIMVVGLLVPTLAADSS